MILVADASVLVEYLLRTERSAAVRETIEAPDTDLHIPALCDVEIASALRRAIALGFLSETRAMEAVDTYLDLALVRYSHEHLLRRILALRRNFSAYDAAYVALAEELNAPLLTGDRRLARAAAAHTGISILE